MSRKDIKSFSLENKIGRLRNHGTFRFKTDYMATNLAKFFLIITLNLFLSCNNNTKTSQNDSPLKTGELLKQEEWTRWYLDRMKEDEKIVHEMNANIKTSETDKDKLSVVYDALEKVSGNWHKSARPE